MNDDTDLIARLHRHDREAFGSVFDQYYPLIYRYAYRHLNHVQTAEDITAQAFQRLLVAINTDKAPDDNLKAWLFRVAHNLIIDEVRRFALRDHATLSPEHIDSGQSVEGVVDDTILAELTHTALQQLSEQQRSVVILRFLVECSIQETADILDLTSGAVKATQHRALTNLRQLLTAPALHRKGKTV